MWILERKKIHKDVFLKGEAATDSASVLSPPRIFQSKSYQF